MVAVNKYLPEVFLFQKTLSGNQEITFFKRLVSVNLNVTFYELATFKERTMSLY